MWILEALQASTIATFVRESASMWGYTAFLSAHAMGLAVAVGLSSVVALRVLGVASGLPLPAMRRVYPWIWFGLAVNALSGFGLFAASATSLATMAMFLIKMVLVILAIAVTWWLGRRAFTPEIAHSGVIPANVRWLAFGTLFLWFAAVVTGRLTGYPFMVRAYLGI